MKTEPVIATNRFGLGARPGDLAVVNGDPRGWLLGQLAGRAGSLPHLRGLPDSASVIVEVGELRKSRRQNSQPEGDDSAPADRTRHFSSVVRRHYMQQTSGRVASAISADASFHERLVHFWSNHFAVSADKQPLAALAGLFENEVIRPNIDGSFYDLLLAVEQHPAMILYLDNQRSIGPNSALAERSGRFSKQRQPGLNENLAREILELHTLGVDAGYSQEDVTAFAKVITGWSLGGGEGRRFTAGTPGTFQFRDSIHEPGARQVLGKTYRESGVEQGESVLRDLAVHPATARFIATKLCRHFVSDDPSPATVEHIAAAFMDSHGDLPTVHAALVNTSAAWEPGYSKLKTPWEFVISTFRALDYMPNDARYAIGALEMMGQAPYRPGSPAGWPDTAAHWGGADGLFKRIEWSATVARLLDPRVSPLDIGAAALGPGLGDHSRTAIKRAESSAQGLTLLLMSPEFQRR